MTAEEIAVLRMLEAEATGGPWHWSRNIDVATSRDDRKIYRADLTGIRHPDATLIPAMRNALPALLDAAEERDRLREQIAAVLDDHEAIEDFALSEADWEAFAKCSCLHCDEGAGICPMTVQTLICDHLRGLRDRIATALDASTPAAEGGE